MNYNIVFVPVVISQHCFLNLNKMGNYIHNTTFAVLFAGNFDVEFHFFSEPNSPSSVKKNEISFQNFWDRVKNIDLDVPTVSAKNWKFIKQFNIELNNIK